MSYVPSLELRQRSGTSHRGAGKSRCSSSPRPARSRCSQPSFARADEPGGPPARPAVSQGRRSTAFHSPIRPPYRAVPAVVVLQLAQADQHVRDVDTHRACRQACAAQRGACGRCRCRSRCRTAASGCSDGPRVHTAIGMPADAAIHRAGVQAGTTANALQALAERRRQDARAAVVEDDEVKLLRSVALAGRRGPVMRDV